MLERLERLVPQEELPAQVPEPREPLVLVQLALVRLDEGNREIAVPVEELLP